MFPIFKFPVWLHCYNNSESGRLSSELEARNRLRLLLAGYRVKSNSTRRISDVKMTNQFVLCPHNITHYISSVSPLIIANVKCEFSRSNPKVSKSSALIKQFSRATLNLLNIHCKQFSGGRSIKKKVFNDNHR